MGLSSPVPSTMRHPESVGGCREKRALKKSDSHSKKTIVAPSQTLGSAGPSGLTSMNAEKLALDLEVLESRGQHM